MAYNTTITLRTNSITKKRANKLFRQLGMDTSTAINIFLNRSINSNSIPFDITLDTPNQETWEAIDDAHKHPEDLSGPFSTADELMEHLNA